jgi:O-antigen ligase
MIPYLRQANIFRACICIQAVCFAVLYAIWILPNTILVRNFCLALGAIIGIYQIYFFRKELKFSQSISIILLLALFGWMTLHLLFLSNNFVTQYEEYRSVWKRSFLALLFAFGFALGLSRATPNIRNFLWTVFYIGLLAPTLIYLIKYFSVQYGQVFGVAIPGYWNLYQNGVSPYYVAKTAYMGFCAPVLAISLGQLYAKISDGNAFKWANAVYLIAVIAVLFVFYKENIKNGIAYSFIFISIFIALVLLKSFKRAPVRSLAFAITLLGLLAAFGIKHIENNPSWKTLFADAKVAVQLDRHQNWQCGTKYGYPSNEFGEIVSVTNYERVAWAKSAANLIVQYPLGYGLIERSFGQRGNSLWPGACLSQSHSGWLDLTLGIGIPGMVLLFGSIFIAMRGLIAWSHPSKLKLQSWKIMSIWVLSSLFLIWFTSEISQKVFFEELIFFIAFGGGLLGTKLDNYH